MRIPAKRVPVWRNEHVCRDRFYCTHCERQIWGEYARVVVRVESEGRKYRSALEVERYCGDHM